MFALFLMGNLSGFFPYGFTCEKSWGITLYNKSRKKTFILKFPFLFCKRKVLQLFLSYEQRMKIFKARKRKHVIFTKLNFQLTFKVYNCLQNKLSKIRKKSLYKRYESISYSNALYSALFWIIIWKRLKNPLGFILCTKINANI